MLYIATISKLNVYIRPIHFLYYEYLTFTFKLKSKLNYNDTTETGVGDKARSIPTLPLKFLVCTLIVLTLLKMKKYH